MARVGTATTKEKAVEMAAHYRNGKTEVYVRHTNTNLWSIYCYDLKSNRAPHAKMIPTRDETNWQILWTNRQREELG